MIIIIIVLMAVKTRGVFLCGTPPRYPVSPLSLNKHLIK